VAAAADEAIGKLIYTFPAGAHLLSATSMNITLQGGGTVDADTPDVGIGTVIATGAVAVLGGTAAFENILTGQTFTDCDGTEEIAVVGSTTTLAKTTAAYAVYFNVAADWAASGDAAAEISGDVVITWEVIE
jgi:hypothetical protein